MRCLLLATLLSTACSLHGVAAVPGPFPAEDEPAIRPYFAQSGPRTSVTERCYALVRSQVALADLWGRHMGEGVERAAQGWPLVPQVDFETCMVFAVFSGERVNANGERVEAIDDLGDRLRIRYDTMTFQTASFDGTDAGMRARPYGIFVIPRHDKPVLVEENTQGLLGHPAVWTARAVLDPNGPSWFIRK